jgi:hypothetical protein
MLKNVLRGGHQFSRDKSNFERQIKFWSNFGGHQILRGGHQFSSSGHQILIGAWIAKSRKQEVGSNACQSC